VFPRKTLGGRIVIENEDLNELNVDFFLGGYKGYLALQSFHKYFGKFASSYFLCSTPGEQFDILDATRSFNLKDKLQYGQHLSRDRIAICVGWRKLILEDYLRVIVFHDSLLPKLRGWNPLVTALERGEKEIGVSVIYGESDIDSGPIIFQKALTITYPSTLQRALLQLRDVYDQAALYLSRFDSLADLPCVLQDHSLATYSLWRDDHDFVIDWSKSNVWIQNFINSRSWPYQGASTHWNGLLLRVLSVEIYEKEIVFENRSPGKIFGFENGHPIIVCGIGMVIITDLRKEDGSSFSITKLRSRLV